jgi:monoamine oxidase
MYDASTEDSSNTAALTVFAIAPPATSDDALVEACKTQIQSAWRRVGLEDTAQLHSHVLAYVQRWQNEAWIHHDPSDLSVHHPQASASLASAEWDGALLFAGTETADEEPGYIAGAIRSALRAAEEAMRARI